jgi:Ca-activated chloride channel family protein
MAQTAPPAEPAPDASAATKPKESRREAPMDAGGEAARGDALAGADNKGQPDPNAGLISPPKTEAAEKKTAEATATEVPVASNSMADDGSIKNDKDRDNRAENEEQVGRKGGSMAYSPDSDPRWDWGATTYLSNDDSMSLASAQRMLWALQNRGSVSASQIRPHEFLNYFSFDTRPVASGETFSVLAAAEETAPGTLTMSMAVKGATPARMPLDLTLVIDRSGSMSAEGRMDYLKRGLNKMVAENLKRGDRIDMVLFDHELCTPLENYVVGRDDPEILTSVINALQPRGSTDLDLGMREGYRIANGHVDTNSRNRRVMLISDALLNTGDVNPDTVSQVGKAYDESGIRLTAIGVGREFNDKVLDKLSEKGKGAYIYLGSEAVVDRIFGVGFESMTRTIAHNVRFALDLPDSLAIEKFYGEEASTNPEDVQPIHYYSGTTQLFLQDLHMRSTGASSSDPVVLTVSWEDPQTGAAKSQVFQANVGELLAGDKHNLRKARSLMAWTDMLTARALGANPCGAPFTVYKDRVDVLGSDTEINWLDGLTRPLCGETSPPPRPSGVAYKVKVDSDMPIAEVSLSCNGSKVADSLSGSDTVASFTVNPGSSCILTLQGNVPMQTTVQIPVTGGDVRCMVRGGRMSCS